MHASIGFKTEILSYYLGLGWMDITSQSEWVLKNCVRSLKKDLPLTGLSQPSSESGAVSEDGEEFVDGRGQSGAQTAAVSTTSEEAHSETGQKTRGSKSQKVLQTIPCRAPECDAQGQLPTAD